MNVEKLMKMAGAVGTTTANDTWPDNLRKLAQQFQKETPGAAATTTQDDDDDVPELVAGETFKARRDINRKICSNCYATC
ncbi:hypothetical protein L6452_42455 [Arctium lappa]|uniref:Uncharacterized protein n=1 Tax=Arctium lappa TaxID=4217 RepID=A0ACB8XJ22_ARCLA|nr:hypothetical protein L6452_42455 [Arctium lappa]